MKHTCKTLDFGNSCVYFYIPLIWKSRWGVGICVGGIFLHETGPLNYPRIFKCVGHPLLQSVPYFVLFYLSKSLYLHSSRFCLINIKKVLLVNPSDNVIAFGILMTIIRTGWTIFQITLLRLLTFLLGTLIITAPLSWSYFYLLTLLMAME